MVGRRVRWVVVVLTLAAVAALAGCTDEGGGAAPGSGLACPGWPVCEPAADGTVAPLRVSVQGEVPHDPEAYTQGTVIVGDTLYESTGQYGESSLREVDAATGAVRRQVALDPALFGEGLALVGDRLIQLTWKEGVALVWDVGSFQEVDRFRYEGQGWGLCHDGIRLVMSDGSSRLTFRDPATFEATGSVDVTLDGAPVTQLNELECVGDRVYANVYLSERIVAIDPATGRVVATIDASGLLDEAERATGVDVLNGIAWDEERQVFLLTGKDWPTSFEAVFVPA